MEATWADVVFAGMLALSIEQRSTEMSMLLPHRHLD